MGIGIIFSSLFVRGNKGSFFTVLFILIFGVIFALWPFTFVVLPYLLCDIVYLVGYVFGVTCIFVMWIIKRNMAKRTKYGNEMYGKIKGFRNFLKTAEKSKLELMVSENPNYFYDILPYAYVLEVSDKWIEKFEVIATEPPAWYEGSRPFNMRNFGNSISSTMNSANSYMSSRPASSGSSGSGSSGGGSSGGGSGGGGGGSW